jgi:hypothetical protein
VPASAQRVQASSLHESGGDVAAAAGEDASLAAAGTDGAARQPSLSREPPAAAQPQAAAAPVAVIAPRLGPPRPYAPPGATFPMPYPGFAAVTATAGYVVTAPPPPLPDWLQPSFAGLAAQQQRSAESDSHDDESCIVCLDAARDTVRNDLLC